MIEPLECMDSYPGESSTCRGAVEFRSPLSATGQSYPRCENHWQHRLDREEELRQRYPQMAPADWSPFDAGEAWGEDDY